MQCILYKIYFLKVFHLYYNLICIFICTPVCTKKNFILVKSGCYKYIVRYCYDTIVATVTPGVSHLSPLGDGLGTVIMGLARGGPLVLQRTMTGEHIEGFPMIPSGEGRAGLPFQGTQSMEAPPTLTTTIPLQ
jgi:hypothetical protein